MKYCPTAHILYLRITKQTYLIESPPPTRQDHNKAVSGIDYIKYTTALIENTFLYDKYRNNDSLLYVRGSNPGGGPIQPPIQ